MRILFFSTAFPQPYEPSRNPDNLERCVALARHHTVRVLSPYTWLRLARRSHRDERHVRGVPVSRPLFFYPTGVLHGTHAWWMWQGIRREASRTIAAFRPDAVLSYWTYPDTAVAATLAKFADVPCVAIVGGSDVLAIDPAAPTAAGRRVQRVLRSVDAIAAVSDNIKERIASLGVEAQKIAVLSAAVDNTIFSPGSRADARRRLEMAGDAQILVWVGRMVTVKALDVLLDAIGRLTPSRPRLRLYLVGDGPLRRSLESKVAAADLANHVVFAGRVAHRDLPDYYRAADVTLLPSAWEGMPNVLLESHACGTPFVASAVGAIPQLANPDFDELITPGDRRQLEDAIARTLVRSGNHRRMPSSGAQGWEEMADQLAALLETARARRFTSAVDVQAAATARTHRHPHPSRSWIAS